MSRHWLASTVAAFVVALSFGFAAAEEEKPAAAPPAEAKPAEAKPADEKPAEAKPAEAKPAETKPADAKPADAKPEDAKPADKPADAKAEAKEPAKPQEPAPGHSLHGEVFNEGPRQKAYLMPGMPKINFPATTKVSEAQAFINQGVGQLHGFWYFEAERSFRQAAALDKDCGIAYWGMAMANIENATRAKKFLAECVKHKTGLSEREVMYIDALDAYFKADAKKKKERNEAYTKALEKLLYKYPQDLDARAFLALQLWKNRDSGSPITSFLAVDALLDQVFLAEPMHPAHHYRIHLWDIERADKALGSAALGGQSSPGIAHMWHMPGHIYSKLKRYDDACWQQEASARTDHAHMMRDRVMPDQIHNFAHNNEWLIRNMIYVGRVRDAIDLAKNMCELPRHPKYNTLTKGSSNYGRLRLYDALSKFEMWDELIALSGTPYLEPTDNEDQQLKRLRFLGMAHYRSGNATQGDVQLAAVQQQLTDQKAAQEKAMTEAEEKAKTENKSEADVKKAKEQAKKGLDSKINNLQKVVDELAGHQAVAAGDFKKGLELLKKAGRDVDQGYLAHVQFQAGEQDKAIEALRSQVSSGKGEVIPRARLVDALWRAEKKDDAKKALDDLREISGSIDMSSPIFTRLTPIAKELAYGEDWRVVKAPLPDTGIRPSLDSLGPFRWQPSPALPWSLKDTAGADRSLAEFRGKPVVVLFFLGHGCLHCAEQLQTFAAAAKDFSDAGISLIAISSDDQAGLKQSLANYKGEIPIPLVADNSLETFKAYRCFDDFEQLPLHGTFFIDAAGMVRWQDISFEPFMDPKFVIGEAKRLGAVGSGQLATGGE